MFIKTVANHNWAEIYQVDDIDDKVHFFHKTLRTFLDVYFPEKSTKISNLDKNWMTPSLKLFLRNMQREYVKRGKSDKFIQLRKKYKKFEGNAIKKFVILFPNSNQQNQQDGIVWLNELVQYKKV